MIAAGPPPPPFDARRAGMGWWRTGMGFAIRAGAGADHYMGHGVGWDRLRDRHSGTMVGTGLVGIGGD